MIDRVGLHFVFVSLFCMGIGAILLPDNQWGTIVATVLACVGPLGVIVNELVRR